MPTRSVSSEVIECPLCSGAGELSRAEVLDRLGVKDFARVAQLSAQEAFRLLESKHTREHDHVWARFDAELAKRVAEVCARHADEVVRLRSQITQLQTAAQISEQQASL